MIKCWRKASQGLITIIRPPWHFLSNNIILDPISTKTQSPIIITLPDPLSSMLFTKSQYYDKEVLQHVDELPFKWELINNSLKCNNGDPNSTYTINNKVIQLWHHADFLQVLSSVWSPPTLATVSLLTSPSRFPVSHTASQLALAG